MGDTWEQHWANGITLNNTIIDTFTATVFNKNTLIYSVDRRDSTFIYGSREYWTKEYGMLNGIYEQAEDILAGCVIDGVLYGDTTVTGIDIEKEIPQNFVLYQNYPNPFNPSTIISYSVKEAGLVKLKVFDVLGSEVAELVNESKDVGYHSVEFSASNLPSGIYIYTLQVNGYSASKKMLFLK